MAGQGRPLPPDRRRAIVRLFEAGWTKKGIANYLGHARETVRKILKQALGK